MQRYEKHKDSGVDWIGEIPEHWEVSRLKNHIYFITGFPFKSEKYSYEGIKLARGINVKEGVFNWDDTRFWPAIENHLENYLLKENDVLVAMDGSKVGKNFCKVSVDDLPILLLQRVARLRTKFTLNANFLYINIVNRSFLYWVELTKTDPMVPHISPDDIKNFIIAIPPISEQQTIATFLDDKTAKIDQTIANKQKEIELLKERRQILIQKAVTKGLDDTVPLKDSGVDWIGEIPKHWEVRKLKYVLTMRNEKIESKSTDKIYVGMENIESQTGKYVPTDSQVEGLANVFYKDDILFGKLRPYLAKVYLSEFDGICSTEFLVYKSSNASFYQRVLLSDVFIKLVDSSTYGAKMPRASADFINKISIPNPPNPEQIQIVTYLKAIEEKIAKAILLKQQEIEKLKEYKTVLIDNVVTGKVKVS
ncbi:restriction endonuclease subunit S [Chryseobacterium sp. FH1]|uniref:restriction endonuclease subunit S n=1 Tax=Chryseobacterium sp. FH1 TaxID=1233951 RepID=UPI0005570F40|nr:restriction endonuclease subunit S [Chryseobacterium sp. FH1]